MPACKEMLRYSKVMDSPAGVSRVENSILFQISAVVEVAGLDGKGIYCAG